MLRPVAWRVGPQGAELVDATPRSRTTARVAIDFGEALLDDGRAIGREILEMGSPHLPTGHMAQQTRGTHMLKRAGLAIVALLATLFTIGVVAWGDVPLPNPNARGEAETVEQAAARTARKYLAPLLNRPTRRSEVSVKSCKETTRPPWSLCTVKVDGVAADCTLTLRLRVFPSGGFSAYGRSLRCR